MSKAVKVTASSVWPELISELFTSDMDKETAKRIIDLHVKLGYGESVLRYIPLLGVHREIALADVHCDAEAIKYAAHWRDDTDFMLEAIAIDGDVIEYATEAMQHDQNFLRAAVSRNKEVLWKAAMFFDADLAMQAVLAFPRLALPRLPQHLRNMPSLWKAAVAVDPCAIRHAPMEQISLEVAKAALDRDPRVMLHLQTWRNHRPFAMAAFSREGLLLRNSYLQKLWCDDKDVVCAAVSQNGLALEHASKKLRACDRVIRLALHQNGLALAFVQQHVRNCDDYVRIAVRQNYYAISFSYSAWDIQKQENARGLKLPELPSSQKMPWVEY